MLEALRGLRLPAHPVPSWQPAEAEPEPTSSAFRPQAFGAYFRDLRFGSLALVGLMRDDADRDEVKATTQMAASSLDAWEERRRAEAPTS